MGLLPWLVTWPLLRLLPRLLVGLSLLALLLLALLALALLLLTIRVRLLWIAILRIHSWPSMAGTPGLDGATDRTRPSRNGLPVRSLP